VIVAVVTTPTGLVVIVNAPLVALAPIVTLTGTWAEAGLLVASVTTAPPPGAGPFNVTVPVEDVPPRTLAGLADIDATTAGLTVRVVLAVVPL
jgi:hypothetical protein